MAATASTAKQSAAAAGDALVAVGKIAATVAVLVAAADADEAALVATTGE